MKRMPRCASTAAHGRVCSVRSHALLCVTRRLVKNGFTGPIPASITALTRLVSLYAPCCVLSADSAVRMSTLWRRALGENRFSGSVSPTISALTALTYMYSRVPALPWVELVASRIALVRRWAAGIFKEIGSRAEFRRRSSQ